MLTRTRQTIFFLILFILPAMPSLRAQNLQSPIQYATQDYATYKSSPFSSPSWDPIVHEGFIAMDREDLSTTIEFLKKSVNLGCESPIVYFKLALAYEALGSYYSSIQYYELAKKKFQSSHSDHRYNVHLDENLGRALYLMGQIKQAVLVLEQATKKSSNPWVLKLLGDHYLKEGDQLQASSYYERLLNLSDSNLSKEDQINILTGLARIYRNKKEQPSAIGYYQRIIEIDPKNIEATEYLRELKKEKDSNDHQNRLKDFIENL